MYDYYTREKESIAETKVMARVESGNFDVSDCVSYINNKVCGQDDAVLSIVRNIKLALINWVSGASIKNNVILVSPTGTGKSYLFSVLNEYIESNFEYIKLKIVDCSNLTSPGYKGDNLSEIIKSKDLDGTCYYILLLDEIDKLIASCNRSDNDGYNFSLQSSLLSILDGKDSKNCLIIAAGAFTDIDECQIKRLTSTSDVSLGFKKPEKARLPVVKDDLIEYGFTYELLGRFSQIIELKPLSKETVYDIIDLRLRELSDSCKFIITAGPDFYDYCFKSTSKYGVRYINSLILSEITSYVGSKKRIEALHIDYSDSKVSSSATYGHNLEPSRLVSSSYDSAEFYSFKKEKKAFCVVHIFMPSDEKNYEIISSLNQFRRNKLDENNNVGCFYVCVRTPKIASSIKTYAEKHSYQAFIEEVKEDK